MATTISVKPEEIARAELEAARKKGTGSFFIDILGAPLMKRHPALSEAVAKYRRGVTAADISAGEAVAEKAPFLGKMLTEEIRTPIKTVSGLEVAKVEKVRRLTAPLVKAQKFLVPIFAYEGLRRLVGGAATPEEAKKAEATMMTRDEQVALLKAADLIEKLGNQNETLIEMLASALHEKQAVKLAQEMGQRGLIAQEDIEKKAAELAKEPDLAIVKKAVDLSQKGFELGKLEKKADVDGVAEGSELDPVTEYLLPYVR